MNGNTDHATISRPLFIDKEAGMVCVDREHRMAGVVQSIFPHACLDLEDDDSDPMLEKDEALGLYLAFMVPAQGRKTQLTRAIMQSGGMRKVRFARGVSCQSRVVCFVTAFSKKPSAVPVGELVFSNVTLVFSNVTSAWASLRRARTALSSLN